jgi:hypothetical protein
MRRPAIVIGVAFGVLTVGSGPAGCACGEVSLDIPSETTVTVPGTGIDVGQNPLVPDDVFPSDLIGELLASELSKSLDTSGYKKEAVKSLKLTRMTLTVTDDGGGPPEGLECFQSLVMFVGASPDDDVKVASSEDGAFDGDPGPSEYDMKLTGEEINPFLQKSDALAVTADVEPGDRPLADIDVRFDFVLTALVDAFKAI